MSDSPLPAKSPRNPAAFLGRRLQRLLSPLRVRRLSLHDGTGAALWISEGELGRTQRRHLQEAMDAFALDPQLEHLERDLAESRAHFFCVGTGPGERSGIVFAVVSARRRPDIDPQALVQRVLASLRRFSSDLPGMRVASPERAAGAPPEVAATPPGSAAPAGEPESKASNEPVAGQDNEASPGADAGSLRSRPYIRLRSGGSTRRYEILDSGQGSMEQDLRCADRLLQLLQRRDARGGRALATFVLPLCTASILSADFLGRLDAPLREAGIATDMLGFGIPATAWRGHTTATSRFIEQCGEIGCFAALEDFTLDSPGFALLRGSAVRCLKLDAQLVSSVLTDRFAHANVLAIVKAARVLGLYCVAKGVKRTATARWLAANGVEFAERPNRRATSDATTMTARALPVARAQ